MKTLEELKKNMDDAWVVYHNTTAVLDVWRAVFRAFYDAHVAYSSKLKEIENGNT